MEAEAKLRYIEVMKKSVKTDMIIKECGLFVHLNMVYLGATPDGVVCDPSSSFEGLLEIKCPHSIADDIPSHHILEYLEKSEQGSRLKYKHPYFYPIQTQLGVTGKEWCDFFVYTKAGHFLERVQINQDIWMCQRIFY